jgi:hypothetical protein
MLFYYQEFSILHLHANYFIHIIFTYICNYECCCLLKEEIELLCNFIKKRERVEKLFHYDLVVKMFNYVR